MFCIGISHILEGQVGPILLFFTNVRVLTDLREVKRLSGNAVMAVVSKSRVVRRVRLLKDGGSAPATYDKFNRGQ
jgi:hypothetical protein